MEKGLLQIFILLQQHQYLNFRPQLTQTSSFHGLGSERGL